MKTKLKEHNVDAYESIKAEFDAGTRKVSAIRATGTGKTYIAVRTSEDFISERADKCLYLSPSNYINDQFKDVVKEQGLSLANYDVLTYQYLIGKDLSSLKDRYNLIITDEFHRLGAEVWSKKVEELLYQNLSASILGLTATEMRYRESRDMNEELGYKCASYLPVAEAIEQHILPAPKYIIGYSNYSAILDNLKDLAIKVQADQDFIDQIKKKKIDWIKSNGLARIVRRHLPKSIHKIIVFCESIERCDDVREELDKILTGAGFSNLKFFIANSANPRNAKKAIKEFSEDCIAGEVKIIISVNMLNEGIHVKGAEACFMFRKTTSGNIYLQQLGRILSNVNNKKHPIVFDLVDNISNDWGLLSMIGLKQKGEDKKVRGGFIRRYYGEAGVEVDSYVEEEKEMLDKLKRLTSLDHRPITVRVQEHIDKYGHWPKQSEGHLCSMALVQMKAGNQELIDLYNRYHEQPWTRKIPLLDRLDAHLKNFNEWPNSKTDRQLYKDCNAALKRGNKGVLERYYKYFGKEYQPLIKLIDRLKKHYREFKEWPTFKTNNSLYVSAREAMKRGDQEVLEFYNKIHKIKWEDRVKNHTAQRIRKHIERYGHWPTTKEDQKLVTMIRLELKKGNQEVIDLYNLYHPNKPWKR